MKNNKIVAFCVAAPHSGSGKTTFTLGIIKLLKQKGLIVQPFKCGPDYIDSSYLSKAAGRKAKNLDFWMMREKGIRYSFTNALAGADAAVIEGVMGMFDGIFSNKKTAVPESSTAQIAALLKIPVILVIDAKSMAQSIAPLVKGFKEFCKDINMIGVVANNVSSPKHKKILAMALKNAKLPPLLGTIPRNNAFEIGERHLGLIPSFENERLKRQIKILAKMIEQYIDTKSIIRRSKTTLPSSDNSLKTLNIIQKRKINIAIAYDEAFNFYYEDNIQLLKENGMKIVFFSPIRSKRLPENVKFIYIGGGFPEIFAEKLSKNQKIIADIRKHSTNIPIYAECGGLMYLGKELIDSNSKSWQMCGLLPIRSIMNKKLKMLGYVEIKTLCNTIFGRKGTILRGHEFHWSEATPTSRRPLIPPFQARYSGSGEKHNVGFKLGNILASYVHLHFLSNPDVVKNITKSIDQK